MTWIWRKPLAGLKWPQFVQFCGQRSTCSVIGREGSTTFRTAHGGRSAFSLWNRKILYEASSK